MRAVSLTTIFFFTFSPVEASTVSVLNASGDTSAVFFPAKGTNAVPFGALNEAHLKMLLWNPEKLNRILEVEPVLAEEGSTAVIDFSNVLRAGALDFAADKTRRKKEALIAKGYEIPGNGPSPVRQVPGPAAIIVLVTALGMSFLPSTIQFRRAPRRYTRADV